MIGNGNERDELREWQEIKEEVRELAARLRMSDDERERQLREQLAILLLTFKSFSERSLQDELLQDVEELVRKHRYILHGLPEEDREALEEEWRHSGLENMPPPSIEEL